MEGQATVVKDIDGDWWSVFEAYEELRQFGYLKFTIAALWYKDATANDSKSHLKLLKGDSEAIEMCSIAGKRGFVDLFVVHEVGDAERFSEGVSAKDIHFTDSEEVYDYESGFGEENSVPKDSNAEKGKRVVTSDLDDEEAADSDHLEQDHMIGGQDLRGDYTEEDAYCEGQKFRVYKPEKDMGKYKWKVGTLYESRQEFKDTVAAFAVQTARNIKFKKCDLVRVQAVCQKNFPFWLYAHKVGEESTWKLRSMNLQHTYMQTHRVGIMHSKWPGTQFKKKVESDRRIKVKDLVAKAHKKWNLTVTKSMTAKTKQEVLSQIQGAFREQYRRINDYCGELLRINPGSTKSFQHCRRFIGLDGCFLKIPQGGQLLTVIGRDPNDHILPIAYAIVETETKDSWVWFLRHLSKDLGPHNIAKCTFISNQQKGLLPAFEEVIPEVDNRFCVRHLYNNFRKKFLGLELKNRMWRCAKASHWQSWEKEMKSLRGLNEGAFRHLNGIPPRFWSRSRFTFLSKCDTLVNNMSESFNAVIVEAREKPIMTMLEDIRVYMMTRWAANKDRVLNYQGNIMPMIRKKIEKWASLARDWRPYWSGASKYEVMCGLDKFVVDLVAGECSCRK
ncbi:uncharacterized protein LOC107632544 [Arachis ipaensis]|uniref:uncharacterized protein LOC107632544 n=1 Tax=Arachis ipaensis TaxID=130454 RepID=UPI0007AF63A4|nr:uncharacterized protein LOC107632544 [Arachis ipaensis]XP_025637251.1 uncharacterized protein LOC112732712 [Arachis hypogaea]